MVDGSIYTMRYDLINGIYNCRFITAITWKMFTWLLYNGHDCRASATGRHNWLCDWNSLWLVSQLFPSFLIWCHKSIEGQIQVTLFVATIDTLEIYLFQSPVDLVDGTSNLSGQKPAKKQKKSHKHWILSYYLYEYLILFFRYVQ